MRIFAYIYIVFEFGEIVDIDALRGYIKAKIPETGVTTEWIPFVRHYYTQSIPFEINQQVLIGRTGSGRWFCMGCTPNDIEGPYDGATAQKYGIKFSDGCLLEYDIAASKLTVFTPGDVQITAGEHIEVIAPQITLDGLVAITGGLTMGATAKIIATADITTTGEVQAGAVKLKAHKHGGVTAGVSLTGPAA